MMALLTVLSMLFPLAALSAGEQIQVMPVAKTPESNTVVLALAVPKEGKVLSGNPVWIQFRLDGYALGAGSSQFARAKEIPESKLGQTVHVVIDDMPYFAVKGIEVQPFNEEGFYYDTSFKFEVPFRLKPGMHTIRMFPARSFGESLKGDKVYVASYFYVENMSHPIDVNFNAPYITYNEPSDEMPLNVEQPVLLDFYVSNCELTPDGYKVRLTVDGKVQRTLTSWQPYYIYGLKKGKHTIRLELINAKGMKVAGPFNDVQQTIHLKD